MNCFTCLTVGGVLFKIYVVGETIKVVRRFSLPNVSKRELEKVVGVFRFPRVSSAAASADDADLDPGIAGEIVDPISICVCLKIFICSLAAQLGDYGILVAELPPRPLLEILAKELRCRLVKIVVFCFH